jgi:hypothetical protein
MSERLFFRVAMTVEAYESIKLSINDNFVN